MKKIELIKNSAGGIDVLTERDSGNDVRILTGHPRRSLLFWQDMKTKSELAIAALKEKGLDP